MDWGLVQTFVDVVEAGSLSEAARRQGVTRSACSQRIKLLEQQANAQLLRRTTRKIEPTDVGARLFERASRMAHEMEAAQAEIATLEETLSGQVRISVPFGLGEIYLDKILLRFAAQHPRISLRILYNNRISDLIDAEIDVAVKVTTDPPLDLVAREICDVPWRLYCTPEFSNQLHDCKEPEDLARFAFLAPKEGRSVTLDFISRERVATVRLRPRLASERLPILLASALESMGVALLPEYMAREAVRAGALVHLLPHFECPHVGAKLFVLKTQSRYPTPAVEALVQLLKTELESIIGVGRKTARMSERGPVADNRGAKRATR